MSIEWSRAIGAAGQSYLAEGFDNTALYGVLSACIIRAISDNAAAIQANIGGSPTIASGQAFQRRNYAVGGSAVLAENTGAAGNYWVENDGTTSGPLLTSAVNAVTALTQKPSFWLYSHGEQEVGFVATSIYATEIAGVMKSAIIAGLRTASGATDATGWPVWVDMLGPRFSGDEVGEYLLRDAMISTVNDGAPLLRGAEKYALLLDNTTHPTTDNNGYGRYGAWLGRKLSAWLLDGSDLRGPSISSAVRSGSNVAVTISVPSGGTLVKPSEPDFFGLWDGSGARLGITNYSWSDNVLTLTADGTPATFRYPARQPNNRRADISRIVRLSDPADPLFDDEPGLPLESVSTVTL